MKDRIEANRFSGRAASAFFLACAALAPATAFAQETGPDPWFQEERELVKPEADPEEGRGVLLGKSKAPRALYSTYMKAYRETPEANITKRISNLEEAYAVFPENRHKIEDTLLQLKKLEGEIRSALTESSNPQTPLARSLSTLKPYADYLTGDPSLLITLLNAPIAKRLSQTAYANAVNGDLGGVDALLETLSESRLDKALASLVTSSKRQALRTVVAERWDREVSESLPGEAYLVGRLTKDPQKKLTLRLNFPEAADPVITTSVSREFQAAWGSDFKILEPGESGRADFELDIDLAAVDTSTDENASFKESEIIGRITEVPNPDFVELAAKYKKLAEQYKIAMENYQRDYQEFLDNNNTDLGENAQLELRMEALEQAMNTPSGGPGQDVAGFGATYNMQMDLKGMQNEYNSNLTGSRMAPVEPIPSHLEVLDQLNQIPSTIIADTETTPYKYVAKILDYTFKAHSALKLSTPVTSDIAQGAASLAFEKSWTKNEGVDERDHSIDEGTFSPAEVESAKRLFVLDFASQCADEFGALLARIESALPNKPNEAAQGETLLLSAALKLRKAAPKQEELDIKKLETLASLARSASTDSKAFRLACLTEALNNVGMGAPEAIEKVAKEI